MSAHSDNLLTVLDRLDHPKVLVVGDLILDRYTWGNAERVSQEAPVILLRADKREARLGGAANVCQMLRGLQAEVAVAGLIGADPDGAAVRHLLTDAGVDASLVLRDHQRPTTVKERFIGRAAGRHAHQILRVDQETRDPLPADLEAHLMVELAERLHQFAIVLISDYDKGVCTPSLLQSLIKVARHEGIPVVVDPIRGGDYHRYDGATTMTPNRLEAELASGVTIRSPQDAMQAGRILCNHHQLDYAVVTLDSDGMVLVGRDGAGQHFPTRPRSVYDITGAGDMVLAAIGMALAGGVAPEDALRLANVAGGLEVEQMGVVPISREQIRVDIIRSGRDGSAGKLVTVEEAARLAESLRAQGKKIVYTNGCFDLLHVGHVTYLEEAAAQGDVLFLGLNSDRSVRQLKGPTRPVRGQAERAAVLSALTHVDYVLIFDDPTPIKQIEAIRPDVLVKGGDYRDRPDEIPGKTFVESYGGKLYLTGMVEGVSTTAILRSVAA